MQHDPPPVPVSVVVGIDVSKATLDCYLDPIGHRLQVPNDASGVAKPIDQLRNHKIQLVVVEATGRLHRRLAGELLLAAIPVALVNPQRARAFARSTGRLEKTDRVDAKALAEFGRGVRHRTLEKLPEKQADLDDLVSRRRALVQMRVAETNRLHATSSPSSPAPRAASCCGSSTSRSRTWTGRSPTSLTATTTGDANARSSAASRASPTAPRAS